MPKTLEKKEEDEEEEPEKRSSDSFALLKQEQVRIRKSSCQVQIRKGEFNIQ